ncbi:hypothetical protein [Halobacillus seohaensis]|uniref:Glycosyltransferase RgtA/B/C/D-like domain-containing protein n=1 Tax=Halobacillus seohaensis TaxID=447421 RepID=A0ABW2EPW3_9BACI
MITVILMFLAIFISFAGYGMYIRFRWGINPSIIPLLLFSSLVTILFIGGTLNILPLTVNLIFAAGLVLFIYNLIRIVKDISTLKVLLNPGIIFFLIASLFFAFLLKDALFIHYDNFSHWGLIVKEMVEGNSLPDDSTIVSFRNYPPGTAIFIYYIVSIMGFSESASLIAQGVLIAGTLASLFLFTSFKKPVISISVFLVSLLLLLIDGSMIYTLLVDSYLGYLSTAIVLISFYYRNQWSRLSLIVMPMLTFLVLVKDSGKIFLSFCLIWIIGLLINYIRKKEFNIRENWKNLIAWGFYLLFVPFFVNYLWSKYTAKAYEASYDSNRHAVTSDTFNLSDRSAELVNNLLPDLLQASFNLSSPTFQLMLFANAFAVLAVVYIFISQKQLAKTLIWTGIYVNILYLIYTALLYILYLFLMPENEAVYLAGFGRYNTSISIFFLGTLLIITLHSLTQSINFSGSIKLKEIVCMVIVALLLTIPQGQIQSFLQQDEPSTPALHEATELLKSLRTEKNISKENGVTVFNDLGESDRFYLRHVMWYKRSTFKTYTHTYCDSPKLEERIKINLGKSDYLLVLQSTNHIEKCLPDEGIQELNKGAYAINDGLITERINLPSYAEYDN